MGNIGKRGLLVSQTECFRAVLLLHTHSSSDYTHNTVIQCCIQHLRHIHRQFRVSCSCDARGDIHTMATLTQEMKASKFLL